MSIILRRTNNYSKFIREISHGLFVKNRLTKGQVLVEYLDGNLIKE